MDQLAVAGFSMILHGHADESMVWPFSLNTTKKKYILHVVGAGTLDADEDEFDSQEASGRTTSSR